MSGNNLPGKQGEQRPTASADPSEYVDMDPDLRERREELWERFIVRGHSYRDVCEYLATQYDVTESAIENDISRMDNWLPKLNSISTKSGASRLRELQMQRQRLEEMFYELEASQSEIDNFMDAVKQGQFVEVDEDGNPKGDLSEDDVKGILRSMDVDDRTFNKKKSLINSIQNSIQLHIRLSQELGATYRQPDENVHHHTGEVTHTQSHDLSEQQRQNLKSVRERFDNPDSGLDATPRGDDPTEVTPETVPVEGHEVDAESSRDDGDDEGPLGGEASE